MIYKRHEVDKKLDFSTFRCNVYLSCFLHTCLHMLKCEICQIHVIVIKKSFLNPVCVHMKLAFQKKISDIGLQVYVPLSKIIKKEMMGC